MPTFRILSPVRLPIPPLSHSYYLSPIQVDINVDYDKPTVEETTPDLHALTWTG
jgi:hypothetical protein